MQEHNGSVDSSRQLDAAISHEDPDALDRAIEAARDPLSPPR